MPPRRSSRSARTSVEPTPAERPAPVKRKRSQPVDDPDDSVEEQENVPKPPSRATRKASSTKTPSIARKASATRSGRALQQVQEDEDEDDEPEESPRPVKKSRSSRDRDEEDVKPVVKPTKAASKSKAKSKPEVIVIDDSSDEEEAPPPRTRRPPSRRSSAAPPGRGVAPRASRASSRIVKAEPVAEEVDDPEEIVEVPPPNHVNGQTRRSNRSAKPSTSSTQSTRQTSAVPMEVVEEETKEGQVQEEEPKEDDNEDYDAPRRRGKQKTPKISIDSVETPATSALPPANPVPLTNGDVDDDLDYLNVPTRTPKKVKGKGKAAPQSSQSFSGPEVEETSLLDALSASPRKSAPPPPPNEPEAPKARLTIHKLALVNFKSYAGRQEIGPFHKSFSSIVGPNGSGKSNTIDALLFVFGYRATKMRQGKLAELIHNSAQYPDLQECSVEVHFRDILDLPGPDAYEVIPNSTLIVSRTAYKNNSSRYTINGRSSNYKEVQSLLKDRGIDLDHNRFLILQGEVESISQMKPKAPSEHEEGLLEYLEDIIGTSHLKEPIEGSLAEFERLAEDRTEKLNRLRIVEREKNALEEKKREAEDYLRLKNEHVRALSVLWQWYIWQCLQNEKKHQADIQRHEQRLAEEQERNKDDIEAQKALQAEYNQLNKNYEEFKAALSEARDELTAFEKQEIGLQEKRKHANSKVKKLKKSLQDDENARNQALRTFEDSSEKIATETKNMQKLEQDLRKEEKELERICESLTEKMRPFQDQINKKQEEQKPWLDLINAKEAEVDVRQSERDILVKKAEDIKASTAEAETNLKELQDAQESKTQQLDDLKKRKMSLQNDVAKAKKSLEDSSSKAEDLKKRARAGRARVDEARASQAQNTSQGKVLDTLNSLSRQGRIHGFHGRLGGLGKIDSKYDVAISTACGALHHMVVDTVDQGQACIEYLRKQNVGRASFMVLEKLGRPPGMNPGQRFPLPRLYDLVEPKDPRFAPAFYKALKDTLVATTLDEANRVAVGGGQRYRVVTLDGELVDVSGTMSGGGTHKARGAMSDKFTGEKLPPHEMRKLEEEAELANNLLDEAMGERRRAQAEVEALQKSGPEIDLAIHKLNLDISNNGKRISEAEKRLRDLRAQSKPDAGDIARIKSLDGEIRSVQGELDGLRQRNAAIQQIIDELNKKMEAAGGSRVLKQKSTVEGLRLHIHLAGEEITKAEVARDKAQKDAEKLKKVLENHRIGLKESEAELESLDEQLQEVTRQVTDLRERVEEAQATAEASKDELDRLKVDLQEKTEQIQVFLAKQLDLQQKIDDVKKQAKDNADVMARWESRHAELELEDVDEDDEEEEVNEGEAVEGGEDGGDRDEAAVKVKNEEDKGEGSSKPKAARETPSNELKMYSDRHLANLDKRQLMANVELIDERLKKTKPNPGVLKEYRKREEEFFRRVKDFEDITEARNAQKEKYDGLCKQRLDGFMTGFNTISLKLKEMYQMITLGGNAELELVDSMDPFSEGIIFSVMPPKKSWRNISNLSGGEKTLSSLALVFALHVYKPTPLYFMDEIDAALDFRNVSIVANYIKDRTKNAQFIIISLRNDMFELSQRLIGIYKTSNQTRSISIDNRNLHALHPNMTATPAPPSTVVH